MKVKIDINKTLKNLESEENLLELSKMELIYQIRSLKACFSLNDTIIEVDNINNHGQAFIKDFDIYIFVDEIK